MFIKKFNLWFFYVIFFIFTISEIYSDNLCDKLAALKSDPNKNSKPVLFSDLKPKLIIQNCTKAIENSIKPENIARFYLQRARGFLKKGRAKDAISDLKKSYKLKYPAAAFALGTLYYLGDDVPQDFELAKKLYIEAYDNNVIWAAKGLYLLYSDIDYTKKNDKLAKKWNKIFISSNKE